MSQVIHPHLGGDGYRRYLGDLHCPLANNVAAQYPAGRAVDDQFAKAHRAPVNDCARGRVERTTAVMTSCVSRAFVSVRPTWAYSGSVKLPIGNSPGPQNLHSRAQHGVGSCHQAVLDCLRDQHLATSNVPSGEQMGRGSPQNPSTCTNPR